MEQYTFKMATVQDCYDACEVSLQNMVDNDLPHSPQEPPRRGETLKRKIRLFVNRMKLWRSAGLVAYRQDGNTITVQFQRFGLFKDYTGVPFVCEINIDRNELD